jgi:superfamily II DNA or RNA helicase
MEGWINTMKIPDCSVGLYLGGMKQEDLDISATKRVVIATYNMAEEAFDCKALNTLIYATPHNNIEQAVGRVLREEKRKRQVVPLIIDLQDTFSSFDKWNRIREKYYKSKGYPMKVFDVADPIHRGTAEPAPNPVIKFIKDINPKEKTIRICERDGMSKNKKVSTEDDESEDDEVEFYF